MSVSNDRGPGPEIAQGAGVDPALKAQIEAAQEDINSQQAAAQAHIDAEQADVNSASSSMNDQEASVAASILAQKAAPAQYATLIKNSGSSSQQGTSYSPAASVTTPSPVILLAGAGLAWYLLKKGIL